MVENKRRATSDCMCLNIHPVALLLWPTLCLYFYLDTAPEGDIALNILGLLFGCGIIPGRILIHLAIHLYIVVTCHALPWARGMCATFLEILALDCIGWKVLVTFDHLTIGTIPSTCPVREKLRPVLHMALVNNCLQNMLMHIFSVFEREMNTL
jgi:hypothetical protein